MHKIIYENGEVVLTFTSSDFIACLENRIKITNTREDIELLRRLKEQLGIGQKEIKLNDKEIARGGYLYRVIYVFKELLLLQKGKAFCKACKRNIPLSSMRIFRRSIADYYKDIDSKIIASFKKDYGLKSSSLINMGGAGGTRFVCANGHELFSTRDWII